MPAAMCLSCQAPTFSSRLPMPAELAMLTEWRAPCAKADHKLTLVDFRNHANTTVKRKWPRTKTTESSHDQFIFFSVHVCLGVAKSLNCGAGLQIVSSAAMRCSHVFPLLPFCLCSLSLSLLFRLLVRGSIAQHWAMQRHAVTYAPRKITFRSRLFPFVRRRPPLPTQKKTFPQPASQGPGGYRDM